MEYRYWQLPSTPELMEEEWCFEGEDGAGLLRQLVRGTGKVGNAV